MKVLMIAIFLMSILSLAFASPINNMDSDIELPWVPDNLTDIEILSIPGNSTTDRIPSFRCDTTKGSPRLHDIDKLVEKVEKMPECWHNNFTGSKCTRIAGIEKDLAVVSICGTVGRIACRDVAEGIRTIKKGCTWTMYAGGRWWLDLKQRNTWVALHK